MRADNFRSGAENSGLRCPPAVGQPRQTRKIIKRRKETITALNNSLEQTGTYGQAETAPKTETMTGTGSISPIAPTMLTIRQTAARTGVSEFHIRRLLKANRISHIRTGTKYLVNFDRFTEYLNKGDTE